MTKHIINTERASIFSWFGRPRFDISTLVDYWPNLLATVQSAAKRLLLAGSALQYQMLMLTSHDLQHRLWYPENEVLTEDIVLVQASPQLFNCIVL